LVVEDQIITRKAILHPGSSIGAPARFDKAPNSCKIPFHLTSFW